MLIIIIQANHLVSVMTIKTNQYLIYYTFWFVDLA